MIITVASGKGGTGKTAIATSLSVVIGEKTHLVDVDTENPNSYIYMKPKVKDRKRATVKIPKIDHDKCTTCGKCVDACHYGALAIGGDKILFFENLCHSCAACWIVCPEDAIEAIDREFGTIETGDTRWGVRFTQGILDVSEMLTPTMVRKTKQEIDKNLITVIDGPPGAGCPLDAALDKSDFAILVTEPTIFGYHDLERAMILVEQKGIPMGVVINRSDIGNAPIKELCDQHNVPILMEIPFMREIAARYSDGDLLVDIVPELKDKFIHMFEQIKNILQEVNT